ncbi:MAG: 4-hydroxy-tetrahydrodipicolinate synthase [Planctomycetota bacterium]|jgi:4-hydroxy-tetrahydrodipicolinate synthase
MLHGSLVAIVTPFRNDAVDFAKLEELTRWHVEQGTDGIVPCGTTGESVTLTDEERAKVITTVIKAAGRKVPVVAGAGTNSTRLTIENAKMAKEAGADAVLLVAPYYNKPPQEGLFRHFEAVAKAVDVPQVVYNVPGRTSVNILPETVARLSKLKNVVAIKEASGNLEQVTQIRRLCDINILSGDDGLTFPMMCLGASGVVSVAANLIPADVAKLCASVRKGDHATAQEMHNKLFALFKGLFIETSPIPVKAAMRMMGLITDAKTRLPLCPISKGGEEKLKGILESTGLL